MGRFWHIIFILVCRETAFGYVRIPPTKSPNKVKNLQATRLLTDILDSGVIGDYLTIDYEIRENGVKIETDFDQGRVRFLQNGGGFHPIVHSVASKLRESGDKVTENCSGGEYFSEAVADIPIQSTTGRFKVGDRVVLSNGMRARVARITDASITIDANNPLAGKQLELCMSLVTRQPKSVLIPLTIACGCFWGVELALQRTPGVVYTCVGYTQGKTPSPSYDAVCSGSTGHAEAVFCLFDSNIVDFSTLIDVFWSRHDPTQLNRQGADVGTQYRGGIYFHNLDQKLLAEESIKREMGKHTSPLQTELLPASEFWVAEEIHQQYLEKNTGQSASKSATEKIRCYG